MGESRGNRSLNSFSALLDAVDEVAAVDDGTIEEKHAKEGRSYLKQPLIWIDLEMTGLDVDRDSILQIACIITDGSLNKIIEGEEITVHQPDEVLDSMNEWCVEHHGKSGLTQGVRESTISLIEAEDRILRFIQTHIPAYGTANIAGNSVHVDISFLRRYMPRILDYAHYRIVDVSSIGELVRRWYPKQVHKMPRKKNTHTAMSDIRESIEQLKYYRKAIFK